MFFHRLCCRQAAFVFAAAVWVLAPQVSKSDVLPLALTAPPGDTPSSVQVGLDGFVPMGGSAYGWPSAADPLMIIEAPEISFSGGKISVPLRPGHYFQFNRSRYAAFVTASAHVALPPDEPPGSGNYVVCSGTNNEYVFGDMNGIVNFVVPPNAEGDAFINCSIANPNATGTLTIHAISLQYSGWLVPIITVSGNASVGQPIQLSGTQSASDIPIDSYYWQIVSGPGGFSLLNEETSLATFVPQASGAYVVRLTIGDGFRNFRSVERALNVRSQRYRLALGSNNAAVPPGSSFSIEPSVYRVPKTNSPGNFCGQNKPKQRRFRIRCIDPTTGLSVAGCSTSVTLSMGEFNGGHDHGGQERPLGKVLTTASVPLPPGFPIDPAGTEFVYEAPEVSQAIGLTVSGTGPDEQALSPISVVFNVRFSGSENWVNLNNPGIRVILGGADPTPSHATGYYGSPRMEARLTLLDMHYNLNLQDDPEYDGRAPAPPLVSQAASLPWGGLYDIHKNWKNPHCTHRDGEALDLSARDSSGTLNEIQARNLKQAFRESELNYLEEFVKINGVEVFSHWHLTPQ